MGPLMRTSNLNYEEKAEEFVSKYIDYLMVDSLRYREVSEAIRAGDIATDLEHNLFVRFLEGESDLHPTTLERVAEGLVDNCRLQHQ
jgi:hypothetical protein